MGVRGSLRPLKERFENVYRLLKHPKPIVTALGDHYRSEIGKSPIPRDTGRLYSALIGFKPIVTIRDFGGIAAIGNPDLIGTPDDSPPRGMIKQFLTQWRSENSQKQHQARQDSARKKRAEKEIRARKKIERAEARKARSEPVSTQLSKRATYTSDAATRRAATHRKQAESELAKLHQRLWATKYTDQYIESMGQTTRDKFLGLRQHYEGLSKLLEKTQATSVRFRESSVYQTIAKEARSTKVSEMMQDAGRRSSRKARIDDDKVQIKNVKKLSTASTETEALGKKISLNKKTLDQRVKELSDEIGESKESIQRRIQEVLNKEKSKRRGVDILREFLTGLEEGLGGMERTLAESKKAGMIARVGTIQRSVDRTKTNIDKVKRKLVELNSK